MAIFTKNRFVWSEPWFFCQRVRDRRDWTKALLPAVAAAILISVLLMMARGANLSWWQSISLGLAFGLVVQLGIEAAYLRRDVSFDEKRIEAFGNAGQFTSLATYPLGQIISLDLRRPEEIGLPFAMLVVRLPTEGGIIGIPRSIRLERLALSLHQLGVPVTLSGWTPPTDADSPQNDFVYFAPPSAAQQSATVEAIPAADQNLTPLPDMLLALFIGVWFVLVWLGLLVWVGIYLFQNRQIMSIWTILCCAIGMFASLTIPFTYYEMFGDYFAARHLINVARKRARERSGNLINSFEDQTFAVELILRDTWTTMAPKVIDFGFIQLDPQRQEFVFEGNRERWKLPFSAVQRCQVEEIQYGAAGEGVIGEFRCYVALTFLKNSEPYEIGLRPADKDIGKNSDTRKMRKAVELFEYLTAPLQK